MEPTSPKIQQFLRLLVATPGRISAAANAVSQSQTYLKPDSRSWSAQEVLAHLRACADVWGSYIESMLADEEPVLPDIHPRRYLMQTDYPSLDFTDSLKAFSRQRRKLLKALTSLHFDDWSRGALIGSRRHTVFTQVRRMAMHEAEHVAQIEHLLA